MVTRIDEAAAAPSPVKPRHVLCLLGGEHQLTRLSDAASDAISKFATGFSIDTTYSQDRPDPQMSRSFGVCWDRVAPNAWTEADEAAVADHKSVLYVLGPRMSADNAVVCSTGALFLIHAVIKAVATARALAACSVLSKNGAKAKFQSVGSRAKHNKRAETTVIR